MGEKYNVGDRVHITKWYSILHNIPIFVEYKILDILKLNVRCPILLGSDELGEDWCEFVSKNAIIKIE